MAMLERLRRGLERFSKNPDRGRTSRELTRCATINLRTTGVGFATAVLMAYESAPSPLVYAAIGVTVIALIMRTFQKAEAHFIQGESR